MGKRLRPHTNNIPKCLLKIEGKPIIEHIVDACWQAGLKDIVVVIGYKGEKIKRLLKNRVRYIWNKDYDTTQTMYSLWLTHKVCKNRPLIHLNGDTFFHPLILRKLIAHPYPDALMADSSAQLDKESTRVIVQGGRLRMIGKKFAVIKSDGECLGMRKYCARTASRIYADLGKAVRKGKKNTYIHDILNNYVRVHRLDVVDSKGLPWIEVDFEKDYAKAKKLAVKSGNGNEHQTAMVGYLK
ncbi:MAG: phosphocholine cytidylyltransferase family protein [Nanoarchaeota archaeon]|nr:MAG: phosphocholine cytidylyltransferase family protein [Nanoarchaeota archaeon]